MQLQDLFQTRTRQRIRELVLSASPKVNGGTKQQGVALHLYKTSYARSLRRRLWSNPSGTARDEVQKTLECLWFM